MSTKVLEKTILKKIDELIEILIILSKKEEGYESLAIKSVEKAEEIIPLILHFIDGNTSLAIPMFHQLIMEKLPDPKIISSFGNLSEEVNNLVNKMKQSFSEIQGRNLNLIQENIEEAEELIADEPCSNLYTTVCKAFPGQEILSNYRLGGEIVEIYIPQLKLALVSKKNKNGFVKLNYYCKKHNIKFLEISDDIALDYRKLLRFIRQKAINPAGFSF